MGIASVNPATGKPIKTYDEMTPEKAAAAVAQAHEHLAHVTDDVVCESWAPMGSRSL